MTSVDGTPGRSRLLRLQLRVFWTPGHRNRDSNSWIWGINSFQESTPLKGGDGLPCNKIIIWQIFHCSANILVLSCISTMICLIILGKAGQNYPWKESTLKRSWFFQRSRLLRLQLLTGAPKGVQTPTPENSGVPSSLLLICCQGFSILCRSWYVIIVGPAAATRLKTMRLTAILYF